MCSFHLQSATGYSLKSALSQNLCETCNIQNQHIYHAHLDDLQTVLFEKKFI